MHQLNLINNSEFWPRHDARHFSFLFFCLWVWVVRSVRRMGVTIPNFKAQLKGILWVIKILATSFLFHEIILIKRNLIWFKAICLCVAPVTRTLQQNRHSPSINCTDGWTTLLAGKMNYTNGHQHAESLNKIMLKYYVGSCEMQKKLILLIKWNNANAIKCILIIFVFLRVAASLKFWADAGDW